jgi:hypothetical protein
VLLFLLRLSPPPNASHLGLAMNFFDAAHFLWLFLLALLLSDSCCCCCSLRRRRSDSLVVKSVKASVMVVRSMSE